jgi:hypothetical protein
MLLPRPIRDNFRKLFNNNKLAVIQSQKRFFLFHFTSFEFMVFHESAGMGDISF